MFKKLLFATIFFLIATAIVAGGSLYFAKQPPALAQVSTSHYIRPNGGSYGLENGSDWNNAFDGFPITLVRGDTYYIAGGIYDMSGNIFDDAESGTAVITIKKANATDSGGVAGWDPNFASTLTEFYNSTDTTYARVLYFRKGYYTIDGVTGSGKTGHGILVRPDQTIKDNNRAFIIDIDNATNISLKHLEVKAFTYDQSYTMQLNSGVSLVTVKVANTIGPAGDGLIQYCYFHDFNLAFWSGGENTDNWVIEHSYFDKMWGGGAIGAHAEIINILASDGLILRHNTFADNATQSGITGTIVTHGMAYQGYGDVSDVKIYGNIFMNVNNVAIGTASSLCPIDMKNWEIYNNTFYNTGVVRVDVRSSDPSICPAPYTGTWATLGWEIKNNIFWNSDGAFTDNVNSGFTYDYNYYNSCATPPATIKGAHDLISTESILTTFADYLNNNFNLNTASQAVNTGLILGIPYNTDFIGNIRGSDGVWDIGAYEYVQSPPPPSAITGDFNSDSKVNDSDF